MCEYIQAARVAGSTVKDEIGNEVTLSESCFEDLTSKEAPVTSKGKIGCLERYKVGWDLGQQEGIVKG